MINLYLSHQKNPLSVNQKLAHIPQMISSRERVRVSLTDSDRPREIISFQPSLSLMRGMIYYFHSLHNFSVLDPKKILFSV
jgi:hypothetical protein